jgi:hypothetical protein
MSHELICSWLGLEPGDWPPDHYRLLGLPPGEDNGTLIEQRVHERLDTVRRYQMMHPEQATEAMNRLAQAFVCLTETQAKRAYDSELLGGSGKATATAEAPPPRPDPLAWLYSPVPLPGSVLPPPLPPQLPPIAPPDAGGAVPPPLPAVPPPVPSAPAPEEPASPPPGESSTPSPPAEPVDPLVEAAQSRKARRGLSSRRALYRRIARTRQLMRTWDQVGRFLSSSKRRLGRATDVRTMRKQVDEFHRLLAGFPRLLGEAGQPGYMVLALAALGDGEIQGLSAQQREALGRDWKAAQKLLTAHRDFLRKEVRLHRRCNFRERLARQCRAALADQPGVVLLLLALVALNIAIWRTFAVPALGRSGPPSTPPVQKDRP